jgi:hypothetical protein
MANIIKFEPLDGGDLDAWGPKELAQNRPGLSLSTALLYDDGGTLKISKGQIGFDDGTNKGVAIIDTITSISLAGITVGATGLWAKIEMSASGATPVFTASDITGATASTAIPSEFTGAWDYAKQGFRISATKVCVGLAWVTAAGALAGVVNVLPGIQGYWGYAVATLYRMIRGRNVKLWDAIQAYTSAGFSLLDSGGVVRFLISSAGATAATILNTVLQAIGAGGITFKDDGGNTCGVAEDGGYGYWVARTGLTATIAVGTAYQIAHNLAAIPSLYIVTLICDSADAGYSVGDEVKLESAYGAGGVSTTISADTTNIQVITTPGNLRVSHKSTKAETDLTMNKWKIKARWWR